MTVLMEYTRELTATDARAAGLPLDVLEAVRALERGARLRWASHPGADDRWELEQLEHHVDERLRWARLATKTGEALLDRGLVYRVSVVGAWLVFGLAADRGGVAIGEGC